MGGTGIGAATGSPERHGGADRTRKTWHSEPRMRNDGGVPRPRRRRRLSVPVTADDLSYLRRLQQATRLSLASLARLLLRRGIRDHQRDGKLSD